MESRPQKSRPKKKNRNPALYYEKKFRKRGYDLIIGVDEAGRGPLAGPVVAAAVVLGNVSFKSRIDDSKKLSSQQRENAFFEIINKSVFGIGIVDEKIIDELNILVATRLAMVEAISRLIDKLKHRKGEARIHILIDGRVKLDTSTSLSINGERSRTIDISLPFTNIIKGDCRSRSIACASILAKVIRDRVMLLYDKIYPQYGFCRHKGYPTKMHRIALRRFGPSIIHRRTFSYV